MSIFSIITIALLGLLSGGFIFLWLRARLAQATISHQLATTQNLLQDATTTRDNYIERYESQNEIRLTHEGTINNLKQERQQWQELKTQHLEASKASIMQAGSELSSKLLEDHKRENKLAKEESDKQIKQTTAELQQKFQQVFGSMTALHEQVQDMQVIRQALLEPAGAGALSEITLENVFKASGLKDGTDYQLQFVIKNSDEKSLKPDAVVFLPDNNLVLIDSKASSFFMEMARAEGNDNIEQRKAQLKKTMREHLKSLAARNYKQAFEESQKIKSNQVTLLMFVPTDAALETVREIDHSFLTDAYAKNLIPVGPSGLVHILMHAHLLISQAKQQDNVDEIREAVLHLLKSVASLHGHSESVGKQLKSALNHHDKFAASFNRNFIGSIKKMEQLGIASSQNKTVGKLERYQLISNDIEGDAQEDSSISLIENSN